MRGTAVIAKINAEGEAWGRELAQLRFAYMEVSGQKAELERRITELDGALKALAKLRTVLLGDQTKG